MAPKIKEPSMAINISQTATMVIFWKRVFFFGITSSLHLHLLFVKCTAT
ncbi:hypothetical protein LACFE_CDS1429 [Limosilactobacillus fermentum]|uniref:Uncharacterized protein n=1 Tax=Limosilactobacillus fermentum TaxID=1613 RepID=A0A1D7ZYE3_LIMFE|nr:hypothetical protein LACFE_CDS1429 [Limosilactobacillus fermentum]